MFKDKHQYAIIRYATCSFKSSSKIHLLFASVELLHSDRAKPRSQSLFAVGKKNLPDIRALKAPFDCQLGFRRVAMKVDDAIAWYLTCGDGNATIPKPMELELQGPADGKPLQSENLTQEPIWPNLSSPITSNSLFGDDGTDFPSPYLGKGAFPAQVHRLIPDHETDLEILKNSEDARAWLSRRVHFDIGEYPELIGSAVLIVPDPNIRSAHVYLARNIENDEHFISEVIPRSTGKIDNYELTVFEKRYGTVGYMKSHDLSENSFSIDKVPQQLEESGFFLRENNKGLIAYQPPAPFLRSISTSMSMMSKQYKFRASDGEHIISVASKKAPFETRMHEETETTRDFRGKMLRAEHSRLRRRKAKNYGQIWFIDQDEARTFIRSLISRANEQITIIDPYAAGAQVIDYAAFVSTDQIKVNVLTSFAPLNLPENTDFASSKKELLDEFQESIELFKLRGIPLDIRFMAGGKKPVLHDRFLIIDEQVWFCGNSLNQIGVRQGMILKLPDPLPVVTRTTRIFEDSSQFSDLLENTVEAKR